MIAGVRVFVGTYAWAVPGEPVNAAIGRIDPVRYASAAGSGAP